MTDGFINVAAATPKVRVADIPYNTERILEILKAEWERDTKICVFPELCITAYTCGDLFLQRRLIEDAKKALKILTDESMGHDMLCFVGLPWEHRGRLYNAAAVFSDGRLHGVVTKSNIPDYDELDEMRHFHSGEEDNDFTEFYGELVHFGSKLIFECENMHEISVAAEICEDLWVPMPPSIEHAMLGANVIVNLSASNEIAAKSVYRQELVKNQSARLMAAYIYANAGDGESTQDLVFAGNNIIAENGSLLAVSDKFTTGIIHSQIDVDRLNAERRRHNTFRSGKLKTAFESGYSVIEFRLDVRNTCIDRKISSRPFVPLSDTERNIRCEEILNIQAYGLKKRLEHINGKTVVLGISGGLDSTLAILVCARAFDILGLDRSGIHAITMPCFGTTDRTYNNAVELTKRLGATLHEISIVDAVNQHFKDIGQDPDNHDVTYENAQARERTQILMDMANRLNGLVVGTGDLSELALGWATYNGDHMSMYGVNASVPKTLIRYLVKYYAESCGSDAVKEILTDVLDTPVSPELLPPVDGVISQKTEDIVGPYELHDFFLYYMMRFGFAPSKIYRLARYAFEGEYSDREILKWLEVFYRRFFSQQFKRSCLPDGPKVGSISVSPRGDLRMPSDASVKIWLDEIKNIEVDG